MEAEKEFQDREDKRKQLFLNQKQLLDTFLDMGEALTTRSGFARPENSPMDSPAACGARETRLGLRGARAKPWTILVADAISKAQYDKSLGNLIAKMGIGADG